MPSKKKKYNARFPPARIKKIMQTDEDVGKVAAPVPVIISRALELFIDSLMEKTATITRSKNAKTLSASHIKQAIHSEKTFDFLRDLVVNVPDHQAEDEGEGVASGSVATSSSGTQEKKPKTIRPRKPREEGARGPGRPRKVKPVEEKKASSSENESDEETETDEEQNYDTEPGPSQQTCPMQTETGPSQQTFPLQTETGPSEQTCPTPPQFLTSPQPSGSNATIPNPSPHEIYTHQSIDYSLSQKPTVTSAEVTNYTSQESHFPTPTSSQPQPQSGFSPRPTPPSMTQTMPQFPPTIPQGYPIHNIPIGPYPYHAGMPPFTSPPYRQHSQHSPSIMASNMLPMSPFIPPVLPSIPQYPHHYSQAQPPPFMMSGMGPNGAGHSRPFMPHTIPPGYHPGMDVTRPLVQQSFDIRNKPPAETADTNMPLDMSISSKSRSHSESASTTQGTSPSSSSSSSCSVIVSHSSSNSSHSNHSQHQLSRIPTPQGMAMLTPPGHTHGTNPQGQYLGHLPYPPPEQTPHLPIPESHRNKQDTSGDGSYRAVKMDKPSNKDFSLKRTAVNDSTSLNPRESKSPKMTLKDSADQKEISLHGLHNLMNIKPVTNIDDDDDYDT